MVFKTIVRAIAAIRTQADYSNCCAMIDYAFQRERLSLDDHKTLYSLLRLINYECLKEG